MLDWLQDSKNHRGKDGHIGTGPIQFMMVVSLVFNHICLPVLQKQRLCHLRQRNQEILFCGLPVQKIITSENEWY